MSLFAPTIIESDDLAVAWAKALIHVNHFPPRKTPPLLISIGGFGGLLPSENADIRAALDTDLDARGQYPVSVSAMTIFPQTFWATRKSLGHRRFADFCVTRLLPRLQHRNPANRLGTYFERMMNYSGCRRGSVVAVNQLSFVIDQLSATSWRRQSALQISCFDPSKDHTGQTRRGFPCLQQVGISHDYSSEIAVNAFYPTQYLLDRGYGNYLGLCHLGAFIAECAGLRFSRLNCYVGLPIVNVSKARLAPLANTLTTIVSSLHT